MTGPSDRDLSGAYSLDALTPDERARFEHYIETDDDARAEAIELGDTAVYLGMAVPPEAPPPALKDRLLAMIDEVPQTAAEAVDPAGAGRAPVDAAPAEPLTLASRSVAAPGRVYRFTRRTAVLLAAAAAVLAVLVVGGIALRPAIAPDTKAQALSQIRDASDARTARSAMKGGGTAEVLWSLEKGRAAITVDDLPRLAGSRVYELWLIDPDGIPTRAGLVPSSGSSTTVLLKGRLDKGDSIAMTVEPEGGSDAPTTVPVVAVDTV